MKFTVHGPFEIPRKGSKKNIIDGAALCDFWDEVNEDVEDLPEAIGCYILSIKASKGLKPWYIGKTNKQNFRKECFTDRNINIFNNTIDETYGTPVLMLISQRTPIGSFKKPSANEIKEITELEKMLISFGLHKNSEIKNYQNTKLFKELVVPGIINTPQGGQSKSVSILKKIFSI